mgnify:CR=1 FL=1
MEAEYRWRRQPETPTSPSLCRPPVRMTSGRPRAAPRARSLARWRFRQSRFVSKHCGLHPKRFSALSRWEAQLTATHGEAETADVEVNVGWLALASDRLGWKGREDAFASTVDA